MKWLWAWLLSWLTVLTPPAGPLPPPPANWAKGWRFEEMVIADAGRLRLSSNLAERAGAVQLKDRHQCDFLVNAGFYDTDYRHLGWVQIDGRPLAPVRENRLFDGFFILEDGRAEIGFEPKAAVDFGFQSGPMLVYQGRPLSLTIKADQSRRRMVAALDRRERLIFYSLFSAESVYAGPRLAELPDLLLQINPEIEFALNLDGGSASAFLSEAVFLPEYQTIGGYFCYTKL